MQSNAKSASQLGFDPHNISSSTLCAAPWWRSTGYTCDNVSNLSSLGQPKGGPSQSVGEVNEDDVNAIKASKVTSSPHSDGNYVQEHPNFQHALSRISTMSDESLMQSPQLELVGHSVACTSNLYSDPYYGGMMTVYAPQVLVHPHLFDMHHARMPLPLEMTREPVFVNAKQYQGILRRRQARAKAELDKKLIKDRKPYLHESRHQHAMRRARGSGGRFAKKLGTDATDAVKEKGTESGSGISLQSATSSGSRPVPSDSAETWSSNQEAGGPEVHRTCEGTGYINENEQHQNRGSCQASAYRSHQDGEGETYYQQWGSIPSSKGSQGTVAI